MSALNFYLLLGAVIAAAGLTVFAIMGYIGSPIVTLISLVAALCALILARSRR